MLNKLMYGLSFYIYILAGNVPAFLGMGTNIFGNDWLFPMGICKWTSKLKSYTRIPIEINCLGKTSDVTERVTYLLGILEWQESKFRNDRNRNFGIAGIEILEWLESNFWNDRSRNFGVAGIEAQSHNTK